MGQSIRARKRRRSRARRAAVRVVGWIEGGASLSHRARARLALVDWHRAHGANVSRTARHFGFSRPTVYRWLARYDRFRLETLEDRSSRPRRRRRPTWTTAELVAVRELRARYPRWGKDKLRVLLRRDGLLLSASMIGRILVRLRRSGELGEPIGVRISARRRQWRRPHAIRKPRDWRIERPGDLVQLDTLDVRPLPNVILKQFTARDVVSRWDVCELGRRATAQAAATVLDRIAERMPFPIRAVSVDNGSEFMAEFEAACAERGIALFVLPIRSPKLNGAVERANRTHTEEFYEVTDAEPELEALRAALRDWETTYNTIRPHQALGYLTPAEFLAS
ncbi:MAG: integrase core domain-containing protein, partial [Chloroflexi bacterium]|nr:integrase core domain-containing protein [Chloroflexota bacterium]